jgi:hypothetical protein
MIHDFSVFAHEPRLSEGDDQMQIRIIPLNTHQFVSINQSSTNDTRYDQNEESDLTHQNVIHTRPRDKTQWNKKWRSWPECLTIFPEPKIR